MLTLKLSAALLYRSGGIRNYFLYKAPIYLPIEDIKPFGQNEVFGPESPDYLLGAIIAPSLVPWFSEKIFSLGMVKNDIWFGGESKQNAPFLKTFTPKKAPMPLMSRIGPV